MTPSTSSRPSVLRRIRDIASDIQSRCPYTQESRIRSTASLHSSNLDITDILPYPGPLAAELEASGMETNMAQRFSTAYVTAATRLKGKCESLLRKHYQNPNLDISPNALSFAEAVISRKYHSILRQWKQAAFEVKYTNSTRSRTSFSFFPTGKSRPAFNQVCTSSHALALVLCLIISKDCIPLLERYFDYNAYPSAADRGILAEKTGLTHRQIEVWVCISYLYVPGPY